MTRGSMKGIVAAAAFALASTAPFSAHASCPQSGDAVYFNQSAFGGSILILQ